MWLAEVGPKKRPVLVLTRSEVIDVRQLVTVVEITTATRGLAVEVDLDHEAAGLDRVSAVNCDGIHTVAQRTLAGPIGVVGEDELRRVCDALRYALGC